MARYTTRERVVYDVVDTETGNALSTFTELEDAANEATALEELYEANKEQA